MGIIEELAAELAAQSAQQQLTAANPYLNIASVPQDVGKMALSSILQNPGQHSMGESLGWSLGSGLLSGLLQNMGQDYQATLTDRLKAATIAGMQGQNMDDIGYLPPDILNATKQSANIFKLQKDLANQQALFDTTLKGQGAYLESMGKTKGEIDAYSQPMGKDGANLLNPINKAQRDIEMGYTDKLLTGQVARETQALSGAAKDVFAAIQKNDPLAAATAIFAIAKIQDPRGTVREADEMRVANPGGPLGRLAQMHNELLGKGKVTAEIKRSIASLIPELVSNQFSIYDQLKNEYLTSAQEYGADPSRIKYLKPFELPSLSFDEEGNVVRPPTTQPTDATIPGASVNAGSMEANDYAKMRAAINDPNVPPAMKAQLETILQGMVPRG